MHASFQLPGMTILAIGTADVLQTYFGSLFAVIHVGD